MADIKFDINMGGKLMVISAKFHYFIVKKSQPVHMGIQVNNSRPFSIFSTVRVPSLQLFKCVQAGNYFILMKIALFIME